MKRKEMFQVSESVLRVLILGFVIGSPPLANICLADEEDRWLIRPEEASLAAAQDDGIRPRSLSEAGPGVNILKPEEGKVISTPAEILVQFPQRPFRLIS